MINTERVLQKCGDFNRLQFILIFLFCIINFLSSIHYYSQTIITLVQKHWCNDFNLDNLTAIELQKFYQKAHHFSCPQKIASENCNEWIYNYEFGYRSIISDHNWICDAAWKSNLGQSMFFFGGLIGTPIFGIIADKNGRLPVLILANFVAMIGNLLTIFCTTVLSFAICRLIAGLAIHTNYSMMSVLEFLRPSKRTLTLSICSGIFYCLGATVSPWIAVYIDNWKIFLLWVSLPLIIVPFFYFLIPESLEWLILNQEYAKVIDSLRWIAKINKKNVNESTFKEFLSQFIHQRIITTANKTSFIGFFNYARLRKGSITLILKSMIVTLCHDVLSRNIYGFDLSPFVVFSIGSCTILPAHILLIIFHDKMGKKGSGAAGFIICSISTFAASISTYYKIEILHLPVVLSIIGRFGITIAYISGEQWENDLIPTSDQNNGRVMIHMASFALTFISPHVLHLQKYWTYMPTLIMATLSLIGMGTCFFLPETHHRILHDETNENQNHEEASNGLKFFQFICFERQTSNSSIVEDGTKYF